MRLLESVTMICSCLKLQAVFNIKNALIQLAETSGSEVFSLEKSIVLIRFCEKCPLDGQNGDMLKIASPFQSAGN